MGTCCDKGNYADINMEHTMEGDLNNLVISIDTPELEKDKEHIEQLLKKDYERNE